MILTRPANRGVGRFLNLPMVVYLPGGNLVRFVSELLHEDAAGEVWHCPVGLVTDGATIPRASWSLVGAPLSGPHVFGAFLHDARYRLADCTKEEADLMLWDAILCGGTPETDAAIIVEAVTLYGDSAWQENASKRASCGDLSIPQNLSRLLNWA